MAKKKKHINTDLPIIMDYGAGNISVYDPTGMMPYSEPPITEQTRFKKLGKEMKAEFKWLVSPVVIEYWQENLLNLSRFRENIFLQFLNILCNQDLKAVLRLKY